MSVFPFPVEAGPGKSKNLLSLRSETAERGVESSAAEHVGGNVEQQRVDALVEINGLIPREKNLTAVPQNALDALDALFEYARKKQFTMFLTFAYCGSTNELNTCANQETMLLHIDNVAPIIKKNKDL